MATIMEGGATFWYQFGANVIPANTKLKKTWVPWAKYQNEELSKDQFDLWIKQNAYEDGLAIVVGKLWRGPYAGKYLVAIDCDNQLAIDEICSMGGHPVPLETIASLWLVERHKDAKNKAHIYVISDFPFPKKASNAATKGDKIGANEIPAFEIKGEGSHGIMYASPSHHSGGERYEIIGTKEPRPLTTNQANDFLKRLDSICEKYGIPYLEEIENTSLAKPMLFDNDFKVSEGNNRHVRILAVMRSLMKRLGGMDLSESNIREIAEDFNRRKCVPPLEPEQMDFQWKCALRYQETDNEYVNIINPPEIAYKINKQYIDKEVIVEGKIHLLGELKQVNVAQIYECRQCKIISEQRITHCRNCESEDIKMILNSDTVKDHRYVHLTLFKKDGHIGKEELWISCYDELANKDYMLNDDIRVKGTIRLAEAHEKGVVKNIKELFLYLHVTDIEPISQRQEAITISDEERIKMKLWAETHQVIPELTRIFSPRIVGRDLIKECILYQIVSGDYVNEGQIREDIHILLIGDPSEGKTVLGLDAAEIADGVHTSGESISKAGIGAGIVKLDIGGFGLEPGIAMYGNRKFKFLDEIDKMPKEYVDDMVNILELGMFKIDKIIHRKCETKGPWLCAGNPKNGQFKDGATIVENVNLPNYLLERFDLLFIMKKDYDDEVINQRTEVMANAFMNKKGNKLDSAFLKKYLILAKEPRELEFEPKVETILRDFYKRIVKASQFGGIPVSNRQFLGMFRMSVARAKLHLRNKVTEEDAKRSIEIMSAMMLMAGIDGVDQIDLNKMGYGEEDNVQ